jgi:hypothetical protein
MDLTLTTDEATLLARIVRNYLSDLRMEIRETDSYEWRQSLKHDEALLNGLLSRLPAPAAQAGHAGVAPAAHTSSGPSEPQTGATPG